MPIIVRAITTRLVELPLPVAGSAPPTASVVAAPDD
jgi:hypothetical protein